MCSSCAILCAVGHASPETLRPPVKAMSSGATTNDSTREERNPSSCAQVRDGSRGDLTVFRRSKSSLYPTELQASREVTIHRRTRRREHASSSPPTLVVVAPALALPRDARWRWWRSGCRRRGHAGRNRRHVRLPGDLVTLGVHALHVRDVVVPVAPGPWLLMCPRSAGGVIGLEVVEGLAPTREDQHTWPGGAGGQEHSGDDGKDASLHHNNSVRVVSVARDPAGRRGAIYAERSGAVTPDSTRNSAPPLRPSAEPTR